MTIRFLPGVCALAIALQVTAATVSAQPVQPTIEDTRMDPSAFAVFPWDTIPVSKERYEDLYECGFNLAGFAAPTSLDLIHAAKLKAFVSDPKRIDVRGGKELPDEEVATRVRDLVASTKDHPATFGYHVLDEPPRELFPQVKRWVDRFHAEAPDKIAFVNLFPDYGQNVARNVDDNYHKYMTAFVDEMKPQVLSYDHYALFEDGSMRPQYFPNLETGRAVSQKAGVPFYHVVLANAHFNYAEPTPAWMRFQVYTSLAYGVRGIAWFTFVDRERGNYRNSAVDLYGRRTPTWEMIRDVNLVCHRLAPTLTKMSNANVFHHPEPPKGCLGLADSLFLMDLKGKGPFVVGEFKDEQGQRAVLVVNKSLTRSTRFELVAKPVEGESAVTLRKVSETTGQVVPMSAEQDWLAPGQGMLLLLQGTAE